MPQGLITAICVRYKRVPGKEISELRRRLVEAMADGAVAAAWEVVIEEGGQKGGGGESDTPCLRWQAAVRGIFSLH